MDRFKYKRVEDVDKYIGIIWDNMMERPIMENMSKYQAKQWIKRN